VHVTLPLPHVAHSVAPLSLSLLLSNPKYYNFANTIRDVSQHRIKNTITAFIELSVTITAYALQSNATFPFVTMPMFEVSGQQARLKSGVELFAYCPIVSQAQKASWENYTVQDNVQDWIAYSREIYLSSDFAQPGTTYARDVNATAVAPYIWQYDTTASSETSPEHQQSSLSSMEPPYAPTWQV
jgi:hypothetical protein